MFFWSNAANLLDRYFRMRFESLTYGNVQEFHTKDLYFHVTFAKGAPEPNSHKFDVILNFYSLPLESKLEFKGNSQFCRMSFLVRRSLYLKCDISYLKVTTIVFKSFYIRYIKISED